MKPPYALYSKEQLAHERSIGLELSDEQNENFYAPSSGGINWSNEQFENYLSTKQWSEEIKNNHRRNFKGYICFDNGTISYE